MIVVYLWLGIACVLFAVAFSTSSVGLRYVAGYLGAFWLAFPPLALAAVLMVQWTMKRHPDSTVAQWAQRLDRKPPAIPGDDYQAAARRWERRMGSGR